MARLLLFKKNMNETLRVNDNGSGRNTHHRHVSQADADALYLLALKQPGKSGIPVLKTDYAECNCHWEVPIRLGAYTQVQKPVPRSSTLPVSFREPTGFPVLIYC